VNEYAKSLAKDGKKLKTIGAGFFMFTTCYEHLTERKTRIVEVKSPEVKTIAHLDRVRGENHRIEKGKPRGNVRARKMIEGPKEVKLWQPPEDDEEL
jgi:hypothetical protein